MENIKLNFTGDLSLTGIFYNKVTNNEQIFDNNIISILSNSDFNLCNFEGPATNGKVIFSPNVNVVSPYNSINYLKQKGFNVFNLANNHTFDCGFKGFMDTKSNIIKESCLYFGAGDDIQEASNIVYIKKNDVTVSLLGICGEGVLIADKNSPGVFFDKYIDILQRKIREARSNSDFVILNYHGGEEYTTIPMPKRRRFLKKLINYDIDIIIAHHPHVLQGIEKFGKKTIFYSLGNFIFDIICHHQHPLTIKSAIINFEFTKNSYNYKLFPIHINLESGIVESIDDSSFFNYVDSISDFSNYYIKWMKDSNRVFSQNINTAKNKRNPDINNIPNNRTFFDYMISKRTYKSLYCHLKHVNSRSIFIGFIFYKLLNKIKMLS